MQEIVSGDLKQNPKCFYSYIKRKRQESEGVLFLIDKNGFLQNESTKTADVLNDQFVSAYTHDDIESIPQEGPSLHPAMQRIMVTINGVAALLRELKPHKATGPDCIPTFILELAAQEILPVLTNIPEISRYRGGAIRLEEILCHFSRRATDTKPPIIYQFHSRQCHARF